MSGYDNKLLIIEDEGLIGMALGEEAAALRFKPVGPFMSLTDGSRAVTNETFDLDLFEIKL